MKSIGKMNCEEVLGLFCKTPEMRKKYGGKPHNNAQAFNACVNDIRGMFPDSPLHTEEQRKEEAYWLFSGQELELRIATTTQVPELSTAQIVRKLIDQKREITNKDCLKQTNAVLENNGRKKASPEYVRQVAARHKKTLRTKNI